MKPSTFLVAFAVYLPAVHVAHAVEKETFDMVGTLHAWKTCKPLVGGLPGQMVEAMVVAAMKNGYKAENPEHIEKAEAAAEQIRSLWAREGILESCRLLLSMAKSGKFIH